MDAISATIVSARSSQVNMAFGPDVGSAEVESC